MHQALIRFFLTCYGDRGDDLSGLSVRVARWTALDLRSRAVGPRPTRHWTSRRLGSHAPQGGCPRPRPATLGRVGQVCPPTARDAHQRRQVRGMSERLYGIVAVVSQRALA